VTAPVTDDRQAAAAAFAAWASLQRAAPRNAGALFRDVTVSHEVIGLLNTELSGRRVYWRSVGASSKSRITFPTVAIETIDAWNVEALPLRQESNHVAICDECNGDKKIVCRDCGGRGTSMCPACRGGRKMYGYASNGSRRLLNCTTCRGKGELDCNNCRRGFATCQTCGGEGRVQRWIELETWQRSIALRHPEAVARRFGWDENPDSRDIAADAEVVCDIERPHRLTPADLGSLAPEWLTVLAPALKPGERVARQRLRVTRFPTYSVAYRLGANEEHVAFAGRRLVPPPDDIPNGLTQRAGKLRVLRYALLACAIVSLLFAFGRGAFYRSAATSISVAAFAVMLATIYGAAADWTAGRRRTREWLFASAAALLVAIGFAIAALPRLAHAERLITLGNTDDAESELAALGTDANADVWNDLRVAQIHGASDIDAARAVLANIRADAPQRGNAVEEFDRVILRNAESAARAQLFEKAAGALAQLSDRARGWPESIAAARDICLPLARAKIANGEWRAAGDAIESARQLGAEAADIDPFAASLHAAAVDAARNASRIGDVESRMKARLAAEEIFTSWERAGGVYGSDELVALRVAMARDVSIVEKKKRRAG